ncbi:MAG TPA: pentapeptide repeat-containing protein [Bryobacteraceae bacterium]|nr:pentapeptide repeat-containing protein [Bryobacteraceae bacterium]
MLVREAKKPPHLWVERKALVRRRWTLPFQALEWALDWTAYYLSRWAFLEVLEYLGILSIVVAVVFYFSEAGDRMKQKHYQAWQVINTAQGKGGSGGRIEALQELNQDGQPLVGVDASDAFLQAIQLPHANLLRCNLAAADLRDSNLSASDLRYANLRSANFRHSDLRKVQLQNASLQEADLAGANLAGADLSGASLDDADLSGTDLLNVRWQQIQSIKGANLWGVRDAPEGFLAWARTHGAVEKKVEN